MGPFLLSEEEQEEENQRQLASIAKQSIGAKEGLRPAGTPKPPRPARYRLPGQASLSAAHSTGFATPMIDPISLMAANHLAQGERMAKATNDAIQDEMDRRVAISREQRRMAVELEKKRMEQETERMKAEALLQRLGRESGGGLTIYH